jgi:hypothetical protein
MKENELRVGNYVEYNLSSGAFDDETEVKPLKVTGIDVSDRVHSFVLLSDGHGKYVFDELKPITLTGEILIRFGFGRVGNTAYRTVTKNLNYQLFLSKTQNGYNTTDAVLLNPLQYVHQLQNLYFALTGEELTLTQP